MTGYWPHEVVPPIGLCEADAPPGYQFAVAVYSVLRATAEAGLDPRPLEPFIRVFGPYMASGMDPIMVDNIEWQPVGRVEPDWLPAQLPRRFEDESVNHRLIPRARVNLRVLLQDNHLYRSQTPPWSSKGRLREYVARLERFLRLDETAAGNDRK